MKTQAWGWLAAGVLALGLNGFYQDGGAQWAHQIVNRVTRESEGALAQATGRADWFLAEARLASAQREATSCPWQESLARAQAKMARAQAEVDAMSARRQAQLDRFEANRTRMETQLARVQTPAFSFRTIEIQAPNAPVCPRVHVRIPRPPQIRIPAAPVIHIESARPDLL